MRNAVHSAALVGICASVASGATVTFDPPSITVSQGDIATFRVTIQATDLTEFDTIDLIFGSDLADLGLSFEYDADLVMDFDALPGAPVLVFPSDLFVGGFNALRWRAPLLLGTLRVDTGALNPGTYDGIVAIRPQLEADLAGTTVSNVGLGGEVEAISGVVNLVLTEASVDSDGDGIGDTADVFPADPTEAADSDGDGVGDNSDAFPDDPDEVVDSDADGTGDNADAFPDDPSETTDSDGDGVGDNSDVAPNDATVGGSESNGDGDDGDTGGAMPSVCGMGMISASLFTLLGLTATRQRRRQS